MQELVSVKLNILTRAINYGCPLFLLENNMTRLILDGKDYGDDYIAYNRDYNNKVWEQLRMKQLNEIPIRQRKRPKIKRYKVYDFKKGNPFNMSFVDVVLSTICLMLFFLTIALYTFPIDTTLHW